MTDKTLQERLREEAPLRDAAFGIVGHAPINPSGPEAADALDAKDAEIERLRRQVAQMHGMAREADKAPTAAERWLERIDEVGLHGPSDEYDAYALRNGEAG